MKEKIVINQDWLVKDMKAGVPELDKLFICQKVEQVPTNWEDLKELCAEFGEIEIIENNIYFRGMTFRLNGDVEDFEGNIIGENRTPAQMWQIIKNLIGENNDTTKEKEI